MAWRECLHQQQGREVLVPFDCCCGAVTTCTSTVTPAGAGVSPTAPAAVPGMSGEQQRWVESRSRRRRCQSYSAGTNRRLKKRAERRSPSPGLSSRRRVRRYRASSDSSEVDRAAVSPPRSGLSFIGGTSAWFCPLLRLTAVSSLRAGVCGLL